MSFFFDDQSGDFNFGSLIPLLGGAGTAFGLYSNYQNQKLQDQIYKQNLAAYNNYQNQVNAYNQGLGNYYSTFGNLMSQSNAAQQDYLNSIYSLATSPIDPNQFLTPLSDAAFAAMRRGAKADLAARGVQPGGYWDSTMAEVDARLQSDRQQQAIADAIAARGQALQGLGGAGFFRPQYPPTPIQPQSGGYLTYPSYGGSAPLSSLGDALRYFQKSRSDGVVDRSPRSSGDTGPVYVDPYSAPTWEPTYDFPNVDFGEGG